jgi:hypothetical protein
MPRCCAPLDLSPCYASVLVAGPGPEALERALERVEGGLICPCVTSWCPACRRVSAIVASAPRFPAPSAYFAHLLALHARLEGGASGVPGPPI